jgi:hypothetical protein
MQMSTTTNLKHHSIDYDKKIIGFTSQMDTLAFDALLLHINCTAAMKNCTLKMSAPTNL